MKRKILIIFAHQAVKTFRRHDEKFLLELAEMQHDRKELIRGTRRRIEDLEKLLLAEIDNIGKDKDLGWDATSLKEEFGKSPANSRKSE